MERILIFCIVLMVLSFSCNKEKPQSIEITDSNIIHTLRYQNQTILGGLVGFIETNHLDNPCSNDLLKDIFELYIYVDSVHTVLINQSGGYNPETGVLMGRNDYEIGIRVFKSTNFIQQLEKKVNNLSKYKEYHFYEGVIKSLDTSIQPFYFGVGSKTYESKYSIENIYLDFVVSKSGILNTEIMYFEMLKNGCSE